MEVLPTKSHVMTNPLLRNKFEISADDEIIELSLLNISKYFKKLYLLTLFKNEPIDISIYSRQLDPEVWKSFSNKLVIDETSIKAVKNFDHNHNLILVNSSDIEQFNHFGLELDEKILVLPIFSVSYKNLKNYLKIYEGNFVVKDIYNILVLSHMFYKKSDLSYNSLIYMTDMIKNIDEANYWTRRYNCLHTISKNWSNRMFKLKVTRNLNDPEVIKVISDLERDNKINDYLDRIFTEKNFIDAASNLKKNGFRLYSISEPCDLTKNDMTMLFNKLNKTQKYYMFSYLVISKKYCHLVLNNYDILKMMSQCIVFFSELYRYLFGYAWTRFLLEEGIKKSYINKDDDFVYDINTASLLPVFPFSMNEMKKNPYFPIKIDDKYLQSSRNLGGISFYKSLEDIHYCGGIVDLLGFKKRLNVFITANSENDIFSNLNWKDLSIGISGSTMTACLQKQHPLMALFKGKNSFYEVSDFDLDYTRYFNEYYPNSDVDIMIKSSHPLDFIKKCKEIFNQIVVNICGFNPSNAEPNHVKMKTKRTVYLFVSEEFINKNIVNDDYQFDYLIENLKSEEVIKLFSPFIDKKIKSFNDELYNEYSIDEYQDICQFHPELFDENDTDYQIHISKRKSKVESNEQVLDIREEDLDQVFEDNGDMISVQSDNSQSSKFEDIGINISFKVKISSNHIQRPLELFSCLGNDFFSMVSKFHLPCVRAYYDGDNVYMTPSCISAHLTYMNLDYKYFAGSNDEISIILKYRMRGFGTLLNKNEMDKVIKYCSSITFWSRLYNINLEDKDTIKESLGSLDYDHKVFHPRLFNADLPEYDNAPYVNINDGYNNVDPLEKISKKEDIVKQITENMKGFHFDFNLIDFQTVGGDGYVKPVQKWLIDTVYNFGSYFYNETSNEEKKDEVFLDKIPISPINSSSKLINISEE